MSVYECEQQAASVVELSALRPEIAAYHTGMMALWVYDDPAKSTMRGRSPKDHALAGVLEEFDEITWDSNRRFSDYDRLTALEGEERIVGPEEAIKLHLAEVGDFVCYLHMLLFFTYGLRLEEAARDVTLQELDEVSNVDLLGILDDKVSEAETMQREGHSPSLRRFQKSVDGLLATVVQLSGRSEASQLDEAEQERVLTAVSKVLGATVLLVGVKFGVTLGQVLEGNTEKLGGRKVRGTILRDPKHLGDTR